MFLSWEIGFVDDRVDVQSMNMFQTVNCFVVG